MTNKHVGITSMVLRALLEGQRLNRKDFNNGSLHSWISTIRNQRYIPVESIETSDRTFDYFMLSEEIERYINPVLREQQRKEMREHIFGRRQQQAKKKLEQTSVAIQTDKTKACNEIVSEEVAASELTGGGSDE
ncbi:hypothetical protein [Legionella pneumophila]|uniref:Uncharacterized protein n=1 Tax=Legionella pneumophila subsp. pascullei TaxID=91890 RepID=A0AAX2ITT9_LEGPN|nr:hypothetical protein [Legionella pneumophila]AMP90219.1 hypothetical protein AXF35_11190 [Legionella pneumophila subsp. pascullei]AMP92114.1 hypothetical protein AXF36_05610 [Legionella pneumophila subsp. pascullei]AMP95079.1 hypothetical protein AXF37_05500 [Legionella pneumophila subsp. pascullei]SQG89951.1 Uncharacterised protein [Legionella pneumophila subsp. pascullei]VEH05737.1 Uncharacterised protein [Legionella pneumophila subsp. pascullei]